MKFIIAFMILFLPSIAAMAEEQITINITSIDINRDGKLILLISGEKGFPIQHKEALVTRTATASKKTWVCLAHRIFRRQNFPKKVYCPA